MLNTPVDYHTFDHVAVKKTNRNNTYKWSCLIITLVLCALMVFMWYWNEMMDTPEKFVKINRAVSVKGNNNGSTDKNDMMDQLRDRFDMVSERGEAFLTTLIDEADDIADSLGANGANIVNSAGDQIKQIADDAEDDLANLATEIRDELDSVLATAIDKVRDAGMEAIQSVQNSAGNNNNH